MHGRVGTEKSKQGTTQNERETLMVKPPRFYYKASSSMMMVFAGVQNKSIASKISYNVNITPRV